MDVLKFPMLSPDLNLIQNVLGALFRAVFSIGKYFNSVRDFEKTIEEKLACISTSMVKKYITSMRDRCFAFIKSHDSKIVY